LLTNRDKSVDVESLFLHLTFCNTRKCMMPKNHRCPPFDEARKDCKQCSEWQDLRSDGLTIFYLLFFSRWGLVVHRRCVLSSRTVALHKRISQIRRKPPLLYWRSRVPGNYIHASQSGVKVKERFKVAAFKRIINADGA
jgi:hypothetical protein